MRVDTGFATGDTMSIHYDAMLAKLICYGPTRDAALRRMSQALAECAVAGVTCNLDLLGRIVAHPAFAAGGIDTGFIAREGAALLAGQGKPPPEVLAIAALAVLGWEAQQAAQAAAAGTDPFAPWNERDAWWINATPVRVLDFTDGEAQWPVSVTRKGVQWWLDTGERTIVGAAEPLGDGRLRVSLDGVWRTVTAIPDQHVGDWCATVA